MVTALVIGDPHFKVDNTVETDLFVSSCVKLAEERQPDIIVCLGDVLHTHERLHTIPLNKAYNFIDSMRKITKTYVLVGNHDLCLAPDTPVMMWDGTVKSAMDIVVGDTLISDTGTPTEVSNLCKGNGEMYEVRHADGAVYTVNENHKVTVYCGNHKTVFWNETKSRWHVRWVSIEPWALRSRMFKIRDEADCFVNTLPDITTLDIPASSFASIPNNVKERLYGCRLQATIAWPSQSTEITPYVFGMWLGDGDKLGDGFTSADIQLVREWWLWATENGANVVHNGQYNFGVVNSGYKSRSKRDICDSCAVKCMACIRHRKKYGRAYALACASADELRLLIEGDEDHLQLFKEGASQEQLTAIADPEVMNEILLWKTSALSVARCDHSSNPLRKKLKELGVFNAKDVPDKYIVTDERSRLELLAGLVDTDGTVMGGRNITITQAKLIVLGAQRIAQSLGFNTTVNRYQRGCMILYISGDVERIPTRLRRKQYMLGRKQRTRNYSQITVTPVGHGPYYGFEVGGSNRFLLDGCVVTHNCNNRQFLSKNHWMRGMMEWENVQIVEVVHEDVINGEKIVFVPYVEPGRFVEALNTLEDDWQDASCIFAHQEFAGCKMGAITSIEGDNWDLRNPHVVSGHIHSRQIIQDNIYYPGSAMQHAFGESEKNIIAILDIQNKEYAREEVDLGLPRKKIVYMSVDDIDDYVPPDTDDQIKVTLRGEAEDFKALKKTAKYKKLLATGTKVVFKVSKADAAHQEEVRMGHLDSESRNFDDILSGLVTEKADPFLYQSYQLVVNGKDVRIEDVMFV